MKVLRRKPKMRLIAFIVALCLAGAAAAADWTEYEYPDLSFSVHFPAAPTIESTRYLASDGRSFEARIYSVTLDTGVFKMTVAELPDGEADNNALINHAVDTMK